MGAAVVVATCSFNASSSARTCSSSSKSLLPPHPVANSARATTPTRTFLTVPVCHPSPRRSRGDHRSPRCRYVQPVRRWLEAALFLSVLTYGGVPVEHAGCCEHPVDAATHFPRYGLPRTTVPTNPESHPKGVVKHIVVGRVQDPFDFLHRCTAAVNVDCRGFSRGRNHRRSSSHSRGRNHSRRLSRRCCYITASTTGSQQHKYHDRRTRPDGVHGLHATG